MRSGTAFGSNSGSASSAALALVIVLAGCGEANHLTTTAARTKASIHVGLKADSHHPRVGKPWHYEVRVTDPAGRPVPATVHLQILFAGAPVGEIGRHHVANGVWAETIGAQGNAPFPARAKGVRLVFQATVKALGEIAKAGYWISVR